MQRISFAARFQVVSGAYGMRFIEDNREKAYGFESDNDSVGQCKISMPEPCEATCENSRRRTVVFVFVRSRFESYGTLLEVVEERLFEIQVSREFYSFQGGYRRIVEKNRREKKQKGIG